MAHVPGPAALKGARNMMRILVLSVGILLCSILLSGSTLAEDRIDCFETCDTKMVACLDKCPVNKDGDPVRKCRNECAIDAFHPCLDHCPHPRTGLSPAEKRKMERLEKEQEQEKQKHSK
jgi:hypothetical protein